jgi:hypothetical protein
MAVSNNITACVTLMALICAVPVIASGIWFASAQGEECARLARWPVAILGGLILLAALAGFVGAYWNRRRLLAFYLVVMGLLIALLIALLAFAFAVTRGSGAYPVLGRAYDEYRLDGFSMWLRGYVSDDPGRWEGIRSCLAVSDTCKKLARQAGFLTADQFYMSNLTPLQVRIILSISQDSTVSWLSHGNAFLAKLALSILAIDLSNVRFSNIGFHNNRVTVALLFRMELLRYL